MWHRSSPIPRHQVGKCNTFSSLELSLALLCEKILVERRHPEQGFRACLVVMRMGRSFGRERVEAACSRALDIAARTYGSVRSILDNGLDQIPPSRPASAPPVDHPNIRGSRYYH